MSHLGDLIIYLSSDWINVGLGSALVSSGLSLAKVRGLHRAQLTVVEGNDNAILVYEKAGFRKEGVRTDAYLGEDGSYHNAIEMGIVFE